MTATQIKERFPHASESFIRANSEPDFRQEAIQHGSSRAIAELERDPGDGTLGARQVQVPVAGQFLVRLTSVRKRLLDQDNLCEKYHVDCCRYAGLLPGDGPGTTAIETLQEKAEPGAEEFVRIEIFEIESSVLNL